MATSPEQDTNEFIQSRLEHQIREACELHGWAAAVSVANPVDILIMIEDQDEDADLIIGNWRTT